MARFRIPTGCPALVCVCILASAIPCLPSSYPLRVLSTDDGLPQSNVSMLFQDSRGFLWMGTDAGLVRFDGTALKRYDVGSGYPFSLVRGIIEKEPGVFWVANHIDGLWQLRDERVTKIPLPEASGRQWRPTCMTMAPDGRVFLGLEAVGGFCIFDGETTTHWHPGNVSLPPGIISMAIGQNGETYIGTFGDGMVLFRDGRVQARFSTETGLPSNEIRSILPSGNGQVWIGTRNGLAILNNDGLAAEFNRRFDHCCVYSIHRENDASFWICTQDQGGGLVHFTDGQFEPVFDGVRQGMTRRSNCTITDTYGNIFVGTPQGLVTITDRDLVNFDHQDGLTDTFIKGIAQDNQGRLWVGTKQSGLFYRENDRFVPLEDASMSKLEKQILFLTRLEEQVWIGTTGGLLILEDGEIQRNQVTDFFRDMAVRHVSTMTDRSILVSSNKSVWRIQDGRISDISFNLRNTVNSIWGMEVDRLGQLVCATNGHGLWRLDGNVWLPIESDLNDATGFRQLIGVTKGPNGVILFPSRNGALSWDGANVAVVFDRGIPVWDVLLASNGDLWVGTSIGLFRRHGQGFVRYNRGMGLVASEFNMSSFLEDDQGQLWFGGIGGLVAFRRNSRSIAQSELHTYVMSATTSDTRIHFPHRHLTLKPQEDHLTIDFTAISFRHPDKVEFRYRLQGFEDEYTEVRTERRAVYTNLPPGDYTFQLESRLDFGSWAMGRDSFSFSIDTPFWQTPIAFFIYLLAFAGLLLGLLKWRTRRLSLHNLELERRIQVRMTELRNTNAELQREIVDRMSAEAALAYEKEQLAVTLRSITDAVFQTDPRGRIALVNHVGAQLCGRAESELVGQNIGDVIQLRDIRTGQPADSAFDDMARAPVTDHSGGQKFLLETRARRILVEVNAAPLLNPEGGTSGTVTVIRDIDKQSKMEEELFKAQRLDSVGMLAGGIAHDFNNILAGILGNAELAAEQEGQSEEALECYRDIEKAVAAATTLTSQLLAFAKGGEPVKKIIRLSPLLHDVVKFSLRGSNVTASFKLDPDLWWVNADMGQLNQVINNVIINASQAMPSGGHITIDAHNKQLEHPNPSHLPPGDYVMVTIADDGPGIPSDIQQHIFDPFFSTKKEGNGLGLASCYFILEKHGGSISVRSTANEGAIFDILLPAIREHDEPDIPQSKTDIHGHGRRILVMDDEDRIRAILQRMLTRLGCDVQSVRDGRQAATAYSEAFKAGDGFDLVILDWTVPGGMGGEEAAIRILSINPKAKIIVSSGYSTKGALARYEEFGFCGILPKPYTMEQIKELLAEHLNGSATDKS